MASPRTPGRSWPVAAWVPGYQKARLGPDSIGALTAWALIVPECVAYAQIAGVPVQNAFYAAPVALVAYALFGTSSFLIVGATSAAAVLSASTVSAVSSDPARAATLSAALALLGGVILIGAGIGRLGFIADFFSESALLGFLFGMALTIIVRQLGKLVGVSTGEGDFFARLWHLLRHVSDWSLVSLAVGLAAIAALLALERFLPRIPASLVVLLVGIAASAAFQLKDHGVQVVGKIPRAVPTPAWPHLPLSHWTALLGGAFGLALIVFAESFSIAKRFAAEHDQAVDASREMAAMGAANALVGLFRGFAVSGSASRSAAAEAAGATSPMASVIAAVVVLVTGAFLTPLFTDLPEPVLGAIVIVAVRGFLRVGELRRYWRLDRLNFAVAATALLGVLILDLLPGLLIAVVLSLVMVLWLVSRPRLAVLGKEPGSRVYGDVDLHQGVRTEPGLLIVRPDAQLFFGNIAKVHAGVLELVDAATGHDDAPKTVVLDLSASYGLGLQARDELVELRKELAARNVALWYTHVRRRGPDRPLPDDLTDGIQIFADPDQAVRAFLAAG